MDQSLRRASAVLACVSTVLALAALPASTSAATASDPAANRELSQATYASCSPNPSSSACMSSALADINAARAAEGVRAMVLPGNFASMSVPEQLLNLANLERVDRGLVPILGMSAALNQDAQTAAKNDQDPMPTDLYGEVATSNWAGGFPSTLEADFAWMYDDGLGSGNLDCTASHQSGCWGHRHDILWEFSAPVVMGAGYATGHYGPSMAEVFVGGDTKAGPGQPDAPVVRPSQIAGSTAGGTGTTAAPVSPAGPGSHASGSGKPGSGNAHPSPPRAHGSSVRSRWVHGHKVARHRRHRRVHHAITKRLRHVTA